MALAFTATYIPVAVRAVNIWDTEFKFRELARDPNN
jgi:hypothetical protein